MSSEVDFWRHYSSLCSKAKVSPLRSISRRLKGSELSCPVEIIRSEHWPLLLKALSVDTSLTKLQFVSDLHPAANQDKQIGEKKNRSGLHFPLPYGCSEKNVSDICISVAHLMRTSTELKTLKIENLCLKEEDALTLEKAFKDSRLEHFSLNGCKLQDNAFEIICRGLQLSNVQWIDLSSCGLQASDISFICKIIKAHNLRRSSELFPHTLRYQLPVFDDIKGLSRVTLNNNPIGDAAVEMLVNSFSEEVWMKALDLQKCRIGNDGAMSILKVLQRNAGLQLIDLRLNNIDESILDRIALQVALNNVGKNVKYNLGCLWKPRKNIKRISCRKAFLKTKVLKHSPPKGRLLNKESGRVPVKITNSKTSSEEASSQTSVNYDKELRKAKKIITKYNNLLNMLRKCKRENNLLRQEVENLSLQDGYVLIDHPTIAEVTSTFEKYKQFLDIMKDYGLWECIAMLVENESYKDILKPLVIEAIKKCIKIAKSDSSSERISQSNNSVPSSSFENNMAQFQEQFHHSNNNRPLADQSQTKHNSNRAESKLFYRRAPPEMNNVVKPMSPYKALARKVYIEVMENYTNSSHSSEQIKQIPHPTKVPVHSKPRNIVELSDIKSCISETAAKLQQLNYDRNQNNTYPKMVDPQSNTYPKTVDHQSNAYPKNADHQSNTYPKTVDHHNQSNSYTIQSSIHGTNCNVPESVGKTDSVKASGHAIEPIAEISLSSSKSSSDGSSTLRKSNKAESDHSSVYQSLPETKQKIDFLPDSAAKRGLSSKKQSIVTSSSKSITRSSLSSENQPIPESNTHKSSSRSKKSSHKSSIHSGASRKNRISSQSNNSIPEVPKSNKVPHTSSSASSVNSDTDKNSLEDSVHSSEEMVKSYLESVSEASTDKDVKSLSESEVYSSVKSEKDSKRSIQSTKDGVLNKQSGVPLIEGHSEFVKKAANSNSTKSSETKLTQKKVSGGKPEKDYKSESSVPSLSDITTVSSRSLNTDSVMGQLSDN